MSTTPAVRRVTEGLRFPEGPVALTDGSIVVCEIAAGLVTRVQPDGTKATVAEVGGGPNGAALGSAAADGSAVTQPVHGCVIDPATGEHEFVEMPDPLVTNVCFTGDDDRTAYITMSGGGWLGETTWPHAGLVLAF